MPFKKLWLFVRGACSPVCALCRIWAAFITQRSPGFTRLMITPGLQAPPQGVRLIDSSSITSCKTTTWGFPAKQRSASATARSKATSGHQWTWELPYLWALMTHTTLSQIGMPEQAMTRCAELSVVHIDTGLSKGRKPTPSARLHLNSVPADQRLPSGTGHPGSVDRRLVS